MINKKLAEPANKKQAFIMKAINPKPPVEFSHPDFTRENLKYKSPKELCAQLQIPYSYCLKYGFTKSQLIEFILLPSN